MGGVDVDLMVIGDLNPDLVVAGDDLRVEFGQRETLADSADLVLGGSASITACSAARLGLTVAFCGVVGDDLFGRFCIDQLVAHGVDAASVTVDPDLSTGLTVVLQHADDRAIVTAPGSIAALAPRHLDLARARRAHHLHVGSYFLLDGVRHAVPALFDDVRASGATTSVDTNDDPTRRWQVGSLLERCDVLLPNATEACALAGCSDVGEAARSLGSRVGVVAVTLGDRGALACRGDAVVEVDAVPVDDSSIVDAIGAGDNFDAGFLYGFLRGWELERCLRAGLGAAARSLRGRGGTSSLGSIDEVLVDAAT